MSSLGIVRLVTLLVLLAPWPKVHTAIIYNRFNFGLTEIDYNDIPLDVEGVYVHVNSISSIVLPNDFPDMTALVAHSNLLTEFPDLTFVGDTLVSLKLHINVIASVSQSRLSALTRLEELLLYDNYITSFPDVTGLGPYHMKKMRLNDNLLSSVPTLPKLGRTIEFLALSAMPLGANVVEDVLVYYPNLTMYGLFATEINVFPNFWLFPRREEMASTMIRLGTNPIKKIKRWSLAALSNPSWTLKLPTCDIETIPNLMDLDISTYMDLSGNPLICDCRLKWLKVAGSSIGIDTSILTCVKPDHLDHTPFNAVPIEELQCEGVARVHHFKNHIHVANGHINIHLL